MPIQCKFRDDRIVLVTQLGTPTVDELLHAFTELFAENPLVSMPIRILWDGREGIPFSDDTLLRTALGHLGSYPRLTGAHIALLVNSDLKYGLARMSKVHMEMEGLVVGVFKQMEEAESWLARIRTPAQESEPCC